VCSHDFAWNQHAIGIFTGVEPGRFHYTNVCGILTCSTVFQDHLREPTIWNQLSRRLQPSRNSDQFFGTFCNKKHHCIVEHCQLAQPFRICDDNQLVASDPTNKVEPYKNETKNSLFRCGHPAVWNQLSRRLQPSENSDQFFRTFPRATRNITALSSLVLRLQPVGYIRSYEQGNFEPYQKWNQKLTFQLCTSGDLEPVESKIATKRKQTNFSAHFKFCALYEKSSINMV